MSRPTSLSSQSSGDRLSTSYIHPILDPLNGSLPAPNTPFMSHSSSLDNGHAAYYPALDATAMSSYEPTPSSPPLSRSHMVPSPGSPQGSPKIIVKIAKKFDHGVHISPKLKRRLDVEAGELRKQLGNVTNEVRNVTNDVLQHTSHAGKVIFAHTEDAGKAIKKQTEEAGKVIYDQAKQGIKILNEPIEIVEFGWFDVLVGTISVGTFYFDVISDSLVAFYMYHDPEIQQWFLPTLLVLIIPLFVVNMFSLYWYWFDEYWYNKSSNEAKRYTMPRSSRTVWALRILGHLLLHAHVFRYVDIMYYGRKSKREKEVVVTKVTKSNSEYENGGYEAPDQATMQYSDNMAPSSDDDVEPRKEAFSRLSPLEEMQIWIHAERDSCNVDILSSLLQDAPQLILQLHILSFTLPKQAQSGDISTTLIMQLLSVCGSLIAMAWSVTSFRRSVRMSEPTMGNLSPAGLITLTLTHFCSIAPQVLCFALFMTRFLWPFLLTVFGHWLLMTTLVFCQMTCFSHYIDPVRIRATFSHDIANGPFAGLDDLFFSMTFGMILLFTFVDIGFPHARIQGFVFHTFRIVEEAIMLSLWFVYTEDSWYHILPPIVAAGLAVAGVMFLAIYIYLVNPDSPKTNTGSDAGYQNGVVTELAHQEEVYQISTVSGGTMMHGQA